LSGNALSLQLQRNNTSTNIASWKLVLTLFLLTVLTRWPFQSRLFYDAESAGIAFAALGLDFPGAALPASSGALYIAIIRQLFQALGSPEAALVVLSMATSGLASAMLYLLGAALFGEMAGLVAAALLTSSPLFWFYGATGMPYPCDALIAITIAWLGWRLVRGQGRLVLPLALCLALAVGLRPWTALAMLPLALYAAGQAVRSGSLRSLQLVGALLGGGILSLGWLLPIGVSAQQDAGLRQGAVLALSSTALGANMGMFVRAGAWGWGLAALPALGVLPRWALDMPGFRARGGRWGWLYDERVWFCAVWATPLFLLAVLLGVEAAGQMVACLPILLLWSAAVLDRAFATGARRLAILGATWVILGNAALFLAAPEYTVLGGYRLPGAARITYQDHRLAAAIVAIRSFSPSETVILANNWLPVQYYLPGYAVIPYQVEPSATAGDQAQLMHAQGAALQQATTLVWFEAALDRYNRSPGATELQPMALGTLRILRDHASAPPFAERHAFGLRTTPR
jgi:hypothetical protein